MVVGQSYGTVSIALANGFPDLILVVQDLPNRLAYCDITLAL
jgi:hypothetical protein